MESFPVLILLSKWSSSFSSSSSWERPSISHQRHFGCQARVDKTTVTHLQLQKKSQAKRNIFQWGNVQIILIASIRDVCSGTHPFAFDMWYVMSWALSLLCLSSAEMGRLTASFFSLLSVWSDVGRVHANKSIRSLWFLIRSYALHFKSLLSLFSLFFRFVLFVMLLVLVVFLSSSVCSGTKSHFVGVDCLAIQF